jgi:hypothetical protein
MATAQNLFMSRLNSVAQTSRMSTLPSPVKGRCSSCIGPSRDHRAKAILNCITRLRRIGISERRLRCRRVTKHVQRAHRATHRDATAYHVARPRRYWSNRLTTRLCWTGRPGSFGNKRRALPFPLGRRAISLQRADDRWPSWVAAADDPGVGEPRRPDGAISRPDAPPRPSLYPYQPAGVLLLVGVYQRQLPQQRVGRKLRRWVRSQSPQ